MSASTLNGLRLLSARVLHPWRGAWQIDAELDADLVSQAPTSGPAVIVLGGATLVGTVDPRGSGSFVSRAWVRVVGGGGGWDKPVPALHYHVDNGVRSTDVYTAAAAIVGEKVSDGSPRSLGTDYMRSAGPASRVFGDVDWFVDLSGVTQVASRPASKADASLNLIEWDPIQQRAELTCDALVLPGTTLSDPRFNGASPTIRDVEQIFDGSGSHVTAMCSDALVSRFTSALTAMICELGKTAYLKVYKYRIVFDDPDGRLQLQAVHPSAGMPDTLPLSVWPGMSGDSAQYNKSTEVLVHFVEQSAPNQPMPVVVGFGAGLPVTRTIDATAAVHVGPSAPSIDIGGSGALPLTLAPCTSALVSALTTLATALGSAASFANVAAAGTALGSALASLPKPATTKTRAA
jgi:hypothetical protein